MAIGRAMDAKSGEAATRAPGKIGVAEHKAAKSEGAKSAVGERFGSKSGAPQAGKGKIGEGKIAGGKIAGGKNRVVQVRKPRPREWTEKKQAAFLAELAMTGNVTTSVAAVDMSVGGVYNRRAHDPAFAAGWQAALLRGYERLEQLLLATTLASLDRGGRTIEGGEGEGEGEGENGDGANGHCENDGKDNGEGAGNGVGAGPDTTVDAGDDQVDFPARETFGKRGQAVPGAGLIQLSSVTAIQFALAMLNQHRADQARGRKRNQIHRATSAETDAALTKLLDSLARRMAQGS